MFIPKYLKNALPYLQNVAIDQMTCDNTGGTVEQLWHTAHTDTIPKKKRK